jgi:hypothetical protein
MSFVYLIAENEFGPVKVGVANNPDVRIKELQGGNPKRLRLAGSWKMPDRSDAFGVERAVLDEMSLYRLAGEWLDADVLGLTAVVERHVSESYWS